MNDFKIEHKPQLTLYISTVFFVLSFLIVGLLMVENLQPKQQFISRTLVAVYVFFACLVAVNVARQLRNTRHIGLLVFLIGHVFWFAWPALLALLGNITWYGERKYYYSIAERDVSLTAVFLMAHLFLTVVAYKATGSWLRQRAVFISAPKANGYELRVTHLIAIGSLLLFAGLLPMVLSGLSLREIVVGILSSRSVHSAWETTVTQSKPFTVMGRASIVSLASIALFLTVRKENIDITRLAAFIVFIGLFLINYLDSGTRSWTIMMVLPSLLVWLSYNLTRLRWHWVVIGVLGGYSLLLILQFQLQFRNIGFEQAINSADISLELKDNDFFNETAIAVGLVPQYMSFVRESVILTYLTNPIPRSLWPEKPYARIIRDYSFGRDGYDIYFTHGISRLPSAIGQFYMSWGTWGVIQVALATGMLLAYLDYLWQRRISSALTTLWIATVVTWILVSFRGFFPGFHYPVLIIGFIVLLEKYLSRQAKLASIKQRRFSVMLKV